MLRKLRELFRGTRDVERVQGEQPRTVHTDYQLDINPTRSQKSKQADRPVQLSLESVPYYPLPPSPHRWEVESIEPSGSKDNLFELSHAPNLSIEAVNKLGMPERPDTAYRDIRGTAFGCLFIDQKGRSAAYPSASASLLRRDKNGSILKSVGLDHDIYRTGVNPTGKYCAFLSSDCHFEVYDDNLNPYFSHELTNDSRVQLLHDSNLQMWGELKTQIRCVDVSPIGHEFLFTIADTAWSIDSDTNTIWGVSLPLPDGWQRVIGRNNRYGTKPEVLRALEYMSLKLPVTRQDVRHQYRRLALELHPDRNPDDLDSTTKMQRLNEAFSILTGVDPNSLELSTHDVIDYRRTKPDYVYKTDNFTLEISVNNSPTVDWIYAASFASDGKSAYIGSYSGKIVRLDNCGQPEYVIDVGNTPRDIVDIGSHLYIVTDTRIYIVDRDLALVDIIDIFQQDKYVITTSGFGILAKKNLRWFTESGEPLGEIRTKHPIRAVYVNESDIIVETRQHRATIALRQYGR